MLGRGSYVMVYRLVRTFLPGSKESWELVFIVHMIYWTLTYTSSVK